MENILLFKEIGLAIGSILAWIGGKKWIFPLLLDAYNWLFNKKKEILDSDINTTKEFNELRKQAGEIYEKRIDFLLEQITLLQEQVKKNQEDLNHLQDIIKELQMKSYSKDIAIQKFKEHSCCVDNCKYRVLCEFNELNKKE